MNQMLKPSWTIANNAVLVRHSHIIPTITTNRAKAQAGESSLHLVHPACTPCHVYDPAESEGTLFTFAVTLVSTSPAVYNYARKNMKKIDKIDGCHHCPLRSYGINESGKVTAICTHQASDGRFITWFLENQMCPNDCPLPNDNK